MKRVILFLDVKNAGIQVGLDAGSGHISMVHQFMGTFRSSYGANLVQSFKQDGYIVDFALDGRRATEPAFLDACNSYRVDAIKGKYDTNGNRIYYFTIATDKKPAKGFFRATKKGYRAQAGGPSELADQIANAFGIDKSNFEIFVNGV